MWLLNVKIKKNGLIHEDYNKGIILFVSNHLSYLDIPVIGSLIKVKFVAKSEVSSWPIVGFIARLGGSIFVKRNLSNIKKEKLEIKNKINRGYNIHLFPESTSTDGISVLSFKSSLFSSIEKENIYIQPIVINYNEVNNFPLNRYLKPMINWYGDMEFKSHVFNIIKLISICVEVKFLNPIKASDFKNRKSITLFLHTSIYNNYSKMINGNDF